MRIQTVFRAGNSDVVAIPPEVRKRTGLKTGSNIIVDVAADSKTVIIAEVGSKGNKSFITPNFLNWLNDFNKEYGSALQELASK